MVRRRFAKSVYPGSNPGIVKDIFYSKIFLILF